MIVKTELTEEEKSIIREQYKRYFEIRRDFPNFVKGGALSEGMTLLVDLFGVDMFKDIDPDLKD